jgi:hypothetical protein
MRRRSVAAVVATGLGLCALVTEVALSVASQRWFTYDEAPYVLGNAESLARSEFSSAWLAHYQFAAGVSFGLVHYALRGITHLDPARVRAVNVTFLLLILAVVLATARRWRVPWPTLAALSTLGVACAWPCFGLALTELTGLLPAVAGLCGFLALYRDDDRAGPAALFSAALCGACCGLSFYSRPPLALLVFVPLLLLVPAPRRWPSVAVFVASGLLVIAPIVWIWGNVVPPEGDFPGPITYSWQFTLEGMGYAGFAMWCVEPHWFDMRRLELAAAVVAGAVFNLLTHALVIYSLARVATRVLPEAWMPAYGLFAGTCVASAAFVFLLATAKRVRERRHDREWLIVIAAIGVILLSVGRLTQQFSSRYTGVSAPFLALAGSPWRRGSWLETAALGVGILLGALSLCSYLYL